MTIMFTLMAMALLCLLSTACPDDQWTGTVQLSEVQDFKLSYAIKNNQVILKLSVKNHGGFLAFGVSETGHMLGADIVAIEPQLEGKSPVLRDLFVPWSASPPISPMPLDDSCNDWKLLCASEKQGTYEYIVTRALDTKDPQDRVIANHGLTTIIYAWGVGSHERLLAYHRENRGTTTVAFSNDVPNNFVVPADVDGSIDIVIRNFRLQSKRTTYVLQKFDLGKMTRQVVAYDLLIRPEDDQFVHHFLVHDCAGNRTGFPLNLILEHIPLDYGFSPLGAGACTSMLVTWARGGKPFAFPNHVGYRIGKDDARFIVLEMHLDNPELLHGHVFSSGLRLHTTTKLREEDAGCLILGDAAVQFPPMFPGVERYHFESTCPSACTKTFGGDLNVFSTMLHMHSYGREMWSILWNGKDEKRVVDYKQFWSFAFQTTDQTQFKIGRGDWLSTHCVYDTSKASKNVTFGLGSFEEMCMHFLFYYPKRNAGMGCGYLTPTQTYCQQDMIEFKNPHSDGMSQLPKDLQKGTPKAHCDKALIDPAPAPVWNPLTPETFASIGVLASVVFMGGMLYVVSMILSRKGDASFVRLASDY